MRISKRQLDLFVVIVLFLGPLLVGLAVFLWIPLGVAVNDSFYRISMMNRDAARFVGLDNYVRLAENVSFLKALGNTLLYTAGLLLLQIPLGLALAALLNQGLRGTALVRSAVFAPLVASETVIALLWNIMYYPNNGLFNSILQSVGLPAQPFLTSTVQALPAVLVTIVWKDVGFTMLLLLAGMQGIPDEFYEAASIDGAGGWQRFWSITLPLLRRSLLLAVFMATIAGFRIFTPIYLMTEGGPQDSTTNAIFYMYEQAFRYLKTGDASAMAVVLMLILALVTLFQGRVLKSEVEY